MNEKRPPCDGFKTYTELLKRASVGERKALECLGKVIVEEIIPFLIKTFPKVPLEDIEDIAWEALLEFLIKIRNAEDGEYNIRLLYRIVKFRVLDFLKRKRIIYSDLQVQNLQNFSDEEDDEENHIGISFSYLSEDEINEFIKELKKLLTEEENILFDLHIIGTKTIEEVKELTGWSNGKISRMKESIYQKAQDLIEKKRGGLNRN